MVNHRPKHHAEPPRPVWMNLHHNPPRTPRRVPSFGTAFARSPQLPPLAKAPPTAPPRLTKQSSSVGRIIGRVVNQLELRHGSLREAFRAADRDASGGLSRDELQAALFTWRVQAQGRHVDEIMESFDRDGDDKISYAEFCDGLKPFSVHSQPVFGLTDQFVTDRHRVLPGRQVLINDNLAPLKPAVGRNLTRPDYQLYELPRTTAPADPSVMSGHTGQLSDKIHEKFKKLKDAFRSFDENKDGKLSKQELMMAVRCFNLPIPCEHVLQLADLCDADADGLIDYNEFATVLKRKDALGH